MEIREDISKTPFSLNVILSYLKLDEKKFEKNTLSFGGKLDKS